MRDSGSSPYNFRKVCDAFTAALRECAVLAATWARCFDEDQPRIPACQPGAGRWMETGAGDESGGGTGEGSGSAPRLPPAMALDWPGAAPVAYQPPASGFTASLEAIQAAFTGFVTAELATKIITLPILREMRRISAGYDPVLGYPRFASRNIGLPSLTKSLSRNDDHYLPHPKLVEGSRARIDEEFARPFDVAQGEGCCCRRRRLR